MSGVVAFTTKTTAAIADLTAGHTFRFAKSGAGAASFGERILDSAFAQGGTLLPVVNAEPGGSTCRWPGLRRCA